MEEWKQNHPWNRRGPGILYKSKIVWKVCLPLPIPNLGTISEPAQGLVLHANTIMSDPTLKL